MAMLDSLFRLAYRTAFWLLRSGWYLFRPDHRGVMVAVWVRRCVLMVRPSYRNVLTLPGGSIDADETPAVAACRELREETGIAVQPEDLARAGDIVGWLDYRHDHVVIFELRLGAFPALRIDNREIIEAAFMTPETALALPLLPFARDYLEDEAVPQPVK